MGTDWEGENGRYLAAALAWVRARLDSYTAGSGDNEEVAQAERELAEAAEAAPTASLLMLTRLLGLSEFERDVLLLCVAAELDPSIGRRCADAHGEPLMTYPTFGLALRALPDAAWDVLSPQRGLRYWRLIEVGTSMGTPMVSAPLRADERIVNYVKGLDHLDERLATLAAPLPPWEPDALAPSQVEVARTLAAHWRDGAGASRVAQLVGPDATSKRLVAARAAAEAGLVPYRLSAAALAAQSTEAAALARLWRREARLLPLALFLDAERAEPGVANALNTVLAGCDTPVCLAAPDPSSTVDAETITLEIGPPSADERRAAWADALDPALAGAAEELAEQFVLPTPVIAELASTPHASPEQLRAACVVRTRARVDDLAHRVEPGAGWDDLVLPEEEMALVRAIGDQVAHRARVYRDWGFGRRANRGLGIGALFAGPSGTGKTMAAEVLAAHLGLDLYRVDLSSVVSKYIGETEKNLRVVFDECERGGAIVFFDEADALFGKRSEVKDAHDRYANIEVNYLLQRMESYRGLAILATNMRAALDAAFTRRLRFVINFPFPEFAQRREIWRRAFPETAPVSRVDFDRLATLPATGGMIRNIALGAAFAAAAADGVITMPLVLEAARREFVKTQTPVRERDFAWAEPAVAS